MNRFANMLLIGATLIPASAACQVCVNQLAVPKYAPLGWAAQLVVVGAQGQVISVEGRGSSPILVQHAKENVKRWVFCEPKNGGTAHVQLRYDYRLEGVRVYYPRTAKVVMDLGEGMIVITSPPMERQT